MITKEMIKAIAPRSKDSVVNPLIAHLNRYLPDYGVTTHLRIVHFLAQAAHESDSFKTLEEYASGIKYENRKDLGNVRQGDGKRYKGRGIFQLTGRANYRVIGQKIGVDLENNPELAETHKISVLTALEYWKSRGLNKFADADDVKTITKRINGGYNGFEDRKHYLAKARSVIPRDIKFDIPAPATVPVPPPVVVAPPPPVVVPDEYPVLDLSNMPPPPINPITPPIVVANLGDNSPYINDLKDMLIRKGYKITDDDNYDQATENAVKNFQSQIGLPVTGEIDTDTLNRMMV